MEGIEQHVLQTHFGAFLKMHRDQWSVRQREVLFYLPGWTQANYSRLESGVIAPSFDQLLPIYRALLQAGVHWNAADRRQFFTLARTRLEGKKNRPDYHPDSEWEELRYQIAEVRRNLRAQVGKWDKDAVACLAVGHKGFRRLKVGDIDQHAQFGAMGAP